MLIELHDFEGGKRILFNKNLKIIPLASKRYFFHDIRELISGKDKNQLMLRFMLRKVIRYYHQITTFSQDQKK